MKTPLKAFAALTTLLFLSPLAEAARERTGNVDVFIVLDESGSMKPIFQRVTGFIADALVREYMEPGDYLLVVGFSDFARVRVSQRLSSPAEKENLAEIVRRLNVVPQGFTDMGRALEETRRQLELLAHPSHQQILLILTDGVNQPPRDSPYYYPARAESGGVTPPSLFNQRFMAQVKELSDRGYRMHVVGIGADTDARKLAEALGAGHTVLREFNLAELRSGLARFWDETINLVSLASPNRPLLPGKEVTLTVKLFSTSDQPRQVELGEARIAGLPAMVETSLPLRRLAVAPRKDTLFDLKLTLPPDFPAGDHRATVTFEQKSAVKFYPPEAELTFHVPSFWERYGSRLLLSSSALLLLLLAVFFYRRRPIPVVLVVDGQPDAGKPFPFHITGFCSFGGGATDRFRFPGLPQKVAVLERRSVDRFAFISSKPDLVPTCPEYRLGEPIEVRTGGGATEKRLIRFDRFKKKATRPRSRPVPTARGRPASGGVEFR